MPCCDFTHSEEKVAFDIFSPASYDTVVKKITFYPYVSWEHLVKVRKSQPLAVRTIDRCANQRAIIQTVIFEGFIINFATSGTANCEMEYS